MRTKKGVSPLIASVLLVALVIVIAFLIFWWYGELITENVHKSEADAEQVCLSDVSYRIADAQCLSSSFGSKILAFSVDNTGDVKLVSFRVIIDDGANVETREIAQAVQVGLKFKLSTLIPDSYSGPLNVKVIPMIRAGGTTRHCVEKEQTISVSC